MNNELLRATLSERVLAVRARITAACDRVNRDPTGVTLVAVTKTVSETVARLLPELGVPDLGESRPQALWAKAVAIAGARWHLIGHLQRNKLDRTLPLVELVHSVDSLRLLEAIDTFARKHSKRIPVLFEVNCSREANKGGFPPEEISSIAEKVPTFTGIDLQGLMTMAAHHDDPELCRPTFIELRQLRDQLRQESGLALPVLSMGMSNDFEIAIEEGATHIRLGTTLFTGLESA